MEGVSLRDLSSTKSLDQCTSSLELLLLTLSESFELTPKQATALLANNNQFLVSACVNGVNGFDFQPVNDWMNLL